jgi:hypothetical protein
MNDRASYYSLAPVNERASYYSGSNAKMKRRIGVELHREFDQLERSRRGKRGLPWKPDVDACLLGSKAATAPSLSFVSPSWVSSRPSARPV